MITQTTPAFLSSVISAPEIMVGAMLVLFGIALTSLALLRHVPWMWKWLLTSLAIIEVVFLANVILNLFLPTVRVVDQTVAEASILFLTHRWYLFFLPQVLLVSSILILATYGERLLDKHAKWYLAHVAFSVLLSFCVVIVMAFESSI